MEKFQFSSLYKAHRDSVRSVVLFTNAEDGKSKVITVSRDAEAKVFPLSSSGTVDFSCEFTFYLPTQISTVSVIERDSFKLSVFIFGCLDGHIYCFSGYDSNAKQILTHHSQNVTIIRSNSTGSRLASGSWDKSAIVYSFDHSTGEMKISSKISSHMEAVMDVAFLATNRLLTASSDRSIILWDIGEQSEQLLHPVQLCTYMGHEDCVRGLLLEQAMNCFYSISNDQTIRKWNISSGSCEKIFVGHPHFIFGIAPLDGDHFITCGENNVAFVWNKNQTDPVQKLMLPAVTLWSVVALNKSVFMIGASDGNLYVYTTIPELFGDATVQCQLEDLVAKQNVIPFESVSHMQLFEENSLTQIAATSSGEQRLVRMLDDSMVVLYEWSGNKWKPMGHVSEYVHSDLVDHTTGQLFFNGKYYDEVLTVRLNGKTYKLPFNRNQDVWLVASDFIQQNQLDMEVLAYLVKSIVTYANYQPKQTDSYSYFPLTDFKLFTQLANVASFKTKFEEFNAKIDEQYRLKQERIDMIANELQNPSVNCGDFIESFELLFNWKENLFIIYDLLRITLADKFFNTYFLHRFESNIFKCDRVFGSIVGAIPETEMPLQLTSFRVLCNLFSTVHGAEFMYTNYEFVFSNSLKWRQLVSNKNVHLSYASIWYNYSVLLVDARKLQNTKFKQTLMDKIAEIQDGGEEFDVAIVQTLYALGNLIASNYKPPKEFMSHIQSYGKRFKDCSDIQACLSKISLL